MGPVNVGFDSPVGVDSGSYADTTTIADVTGDGLLDLIVGNGAGVSATDDLKLVVFAQQLDGTLASTPAVYSPTFVEGDEPSLISAAGDLDHDGDTDIAAATDQGVDVFLQAGGVLTGPTSYASASGDVLDVQVADLNADDRDDVVFTVAVAASPGEYRVVYRYQNVAGTLDGPVVLTQLAAASRVAVGDVTGDGQPDIVIEDGSSSGLDLLVQQDDLSFVADADDRLSGVVASVFADVTGDGLDDLVALRPTIAQDELVVMAATAGGPLDDPVAYDVLGASDDASLEAADLNGDGAVDLASFDGDLTTLWMQDDAGALKGPCAAPALLSSPVAGKEITAVGDLDGDGVPDFAGGGGQLVAQVTTGFAPGETYATTLTALANDFVVKIGNDVVVTGELTPEMGCLDTGSSVQIWRADPGEAAVQIGTAPLEQTSEGLTYEFRHTPGTSGRFTYHARFPETGVLAASKSSNFKVDVERYSSSLSLKVSDTAVTFGESLALTARLNGPAIGSIRFYATSDGTKKLVDTVKVNAQGKAVLRVKPKAKTRYSAEYAGSSSYEGSTDTGPVVTVAAIVSGTMVKYQKKVDGTAIYKCCRAYLLVSIKPVKPRAPVKITVQYWNGRAWKTLQADKDTFPLNTDGAAVIYLDIQGGAGFRFRAKACWAGDDLHTGDCSSWAPFKLV